MRQSGRVALWQPWQALALLLALGSTAACANILGIDPPTAAVETAGNAGQVATAGADAGSDSGGDAGAPTASGGLGGEAGVAGQAGGPQAGSAGAAGSVFIDGPALTTLCPGATANVNLTAMGGTPPYRWKLLGETLGFSLLASNADQGSHATLSGTLTAAAKYQFQVQVMDADSTPFERPFSVSVPSTPVITMKSVPSVCPNERYSVALTAEGGDPTTYQWSADLPESTGIKVEGGYLKGLFAGSAGASHAAFTLRVNDSGSCSAQPVALDLGFEQPTATVCPEVRVEGRLIGRPPPDPCFGNPYREKLVMVRGVGAFEWGSDATPPGLGFDPLTQLVSGTSTGAGTLTVHATDSSTHRTIETSFALQSRNECWLAYLAKANNTQQLRFFDQTLTDDTGHRGRTKTLDGEPVSDFKFSPDGKLLAYRHGATGGPLSLTILKLDTWQEGPLALDDVTGYQWSADSSLLAVAFSNSQGEVLGVVDAAHPVPGALNAPLAFPPIPTVAASFDSQLVWFDGNHLAYFSSFFPGAISPYIVTASASGFGIPTPYSIFFLPGDRLQPAAKGVFALSSLVDTVFFASDGSTGVPHGDVLISPSGRYAGRAKEDALQVFRATDSSSGSNVAHDSKPGCSSLLAWATGTERVACAHETGTTHDELAFFDVDGQSDTLSVGPKVALPVLSSALSGMPSVFSPNGDRFAYATQATLSIASFGAATPSVLNFNLDTSVGNVFAELAFAPDGQLLLVHRGQRLSFFNIADPHLQEVQFNAALASAVGCEQSFKALDFCGLEPASPSVLWSPSSDLAAFRSATGTLEVEDLTWQGLGFFEQVHVDPTCGVGCVVPGQVAFQP